MNFKLKLKPTCVREPAFLLSEKHAAMRKLPSIITNLLLSSCSSVMFTTHDHTDSAQWCRVRVYYAASRLVTVLSAGAFDLI